jgi:hypothetical protein
VLTALFDCVRSASQSSSIPYSQLIHHHSSQSGQSQSQSLPYRPFYNPLPSDQPPPLSFPLASKERATFESSSSSSEDEFGLGVAAKPKSTSTLFPSLCFFGRTHRLISCMSVPFALFSDPHERSSQGNRQGSADEEHNSVRLPSPSLSFLLALNGMLTSILILFESTRKGRSKATLADDDSDSD